MNVAHLERSSQNQRVSAGADGQFLDIVKTHYQGPQCLCIWRQVKWQLKELIRGKHSLETIIEVTILLTGVEW